MSIYGYIRVSTDRQAEEGESLGAQQRTIEGYAMMRGLEMDNIFVERGVSGSKPLGMRPEGARLLSVIEPGDTLITPKLDRLFRSANDALNVCDDLKSRDISLHMIDLGGDVTGSGISKLVFTILSAVAEAEAERTRERIREVKADQRERHRYLGGKVPFGWRLGPEGSLVEDEAEQQAIVRMARLRKRGLSLRNIAVAMQKKGTRISHAGVGKVLQARERRAGTA